MAKMQKKKEVEKLQKERAAERNQQHQAQGPDASLTGFHSFKNKPDQQQIAAILDLFKNGKKDALIQCINACFNSNPPL